MSPFKIRDMKKTVLLIFMALLIHLVQAQEVKVIKYPELLDMMQKDESSEVVIYNFWATWCAPCVKEMPYFEKANTQNDVTVKFICLDDRKKLEDRVIPFLKRKNIQSQVYLLDETDYNEFIDKVDNRWSGAIPATILFDHSSDEKLFFEKEFTEEELESVIKNQLN